MEQPYILPILYCQYMYHAYWCHGNLGRQGINRHGINQMSQYILSPTSGELNTGIKYLHALCWHCMTGDKCSICPSKICCCWCPDYTIKVWNRVYMKSGDPRMLQHQNIFFQNDNFYFMGNWPQDRLSHHRNCHSIMARPLLSGDVIVKGYGIGKYSSSCAILSHSRMRCNLHSVHSAAITDQSISLWRHGMEMIFALL